MSDGGEERAQASGSDGSIRIRPLHGAVRLVHAYLCYWFVGLAPETYHEMVAYAWLDWGQYHRALRQFKAALKEAETGYAHNAVGYCYYLMGEYAAAAKHYLRAFDLTRDLGYAINLAQANQQLGDIDECRKVLGVIMERQEQLDAAAREVVDDIVVDLGEPE